MGASTAISAIRVCGAVGLLTVVLASAAIAAVGALGRVFFELLVLLLHVAEEVFAEFPGVLDFFGVGTAGRDVSGL